jgi:hypothetical protein
MSASPDLRLVLTRELDTEDLSLEHDTVVVTPEVSRRVIVALQNLATPAPREPAEVVDLTSRLGR